MSSALADTSLFIANETGRDINHGLLPDQLAVSVITLAELEAGVLAAKDVAVQSVRLQTLAMASRLEPLEVDSRVASHWARLRVELHRARRRTGINDLWLAATAIANSIPIVTQDSGFEALAELELLEVIRV